MSFKYLICPYPAELVDGPGGVNNLFLLLHAKVGPQVKSTCDHSLDLYQLTVPHQFFAFPSSVLTIV
jgi:hypothetical protein